MTKHRGLFLGALVIALVCGFFLGSCENEPDDTTFSLSIAVAHGSADMGSVTITGGSSTGNAAGASVTVTATPDEGYQFVRWSNNIAGMGSVSDEATYTFTINANTGLCAVFAPDDQATGIFDPAGTWIANIEEGADLQVTFTSSGGFTGDGTWTISVSSYTDDGTYNFSGNYGTIHSNGLEADIGAYALTDDTAMTLYLVKPNPVTGTFYATKQ